MLPAAPAARPQLTAARRDLTFDVEALDEHGQRSTVAIAGEHPLTLYVDRRELVTLMTLGQAPEALALGFLRNQRLVGGIRPPPDLDAAAMAHLALYRRDAKAAAA